jgi:adenylate cyclase
MASVRRDAVAVVVAALACGLVTAFPPFSFVHGWSIDALTALRWEVFGARFDPAATPVAVIAIDEETYQTPPFKGSPTLTWTTEIGRVLNAVIDGGARVVGFDIVFPTSIELSEIPFGDDLLGARMRGFDRPLLRALATGSAAGKVVLGETLRGDRPSAGQRIAVGQQRNIRALNIITDPDDVVRRIPLTFESDGKKIPSMALELAARALKSEPVLSEDGSVTLAGYRIPARCRIR